MRFAAPLENLMQRPTLKGRSILIVEDEPLIVMDITQAFEGTGAALTTTNCSQLQQQKSPAIAYGAFSFSADP